MRSNFRYYLLTVFIFVVGHSILARPVVLNNQQDSYEINSSLEMLEDVQKNLSITEVASAPYRNKFKAVDQSQIDRLESFSVYWLRLTLKNQTVDSKTWWVVQKYTWQNYIDFYEPVFTQFKNTDKWNIHRSGSLLPFTSRQIKNRYFIFPIHLQADQEITYYLRLSSLTNRLRLEVHSPDAFIRISQNETKISWLFFGIILVMFVYNSFLGLSLWDKNFLYYVIYLITFGLYTFIDKGYALEYFWPEAALWNSRSDMFFSGFSTVFLVLFSISFLQLKNFAPKVRYLLIGWICISFPVNMLFSIFYEYIYLDLSRYIYLLGIPLFISAAFISYRKGYKPAKYYLIGYSLFFLGMLITILHTLSILPDSPLFDWSYQVGTSLEIVLFSLGLANKINLLKLEKEEAQSRLLESQQLQINRLLEISELKDAVRQERRKMNQNLHDHIGAQLVDLQFLGKDVAKSLPENPELSDSLNAKIRQTTAMLRNQMLLNEDLDLLSGNFLEGIHLILLRRYTTANRELEFSIEDTLEPNRLALAESQISGLYSIIKEIASNDLKYGHGLSQWNFGLESIPIEDVNPPNQTKQRFMLQIKMKSQTTYNLALHNIGMGTGNLNQRIAELSGSSKKDIEQNRFSLRLSIPLY